MLKSLFLFRMKKYEEAIVALEKEISVLTTFVYQGSFKISPIIILKKTQKPGSHQVNLDVLIG